MAGEPMYEDQNRVREDSIHAKTSGRDGHGDDHAGGHDAESSWRALCEGRGGVGPITHFDAASFPTRIAAEVSGFRLADYRPDAAPWRDHSRTSQFALAAATLAMAHAGLDGTAAGSSPLRGLSRLGRGAAGLRPLRRPGPPLEPGRPRRHRPVHEPRRADRSTRSARPSRSRGGRPVTWRPSSAPGGRTSTCQTACAASAQAIGEAAELIRRGDADVMLAGGTHSMIHPLGLTGFILLTAMSTRNDDPARASRPFDRDRDGFVLGEGGGVLVLEELEHARARGAVIHGEVAGHCSTADAFRLTDSHDEGRGAVAAMRGALADAGVCPSDVGYINAHGTSTPSNDSIETLAIKRVFGDAAYRVPISSTKSMTGHLVSAGGAVEAIACLLAIRDGVLPPTINLENPDPACDLDYIPNEARERRSMSCSRTASASVARTPPWSCADSSLERGKIARKSSPSRLLTRAASTGGCVEPSPASARSRHAERMRSPKASSWTDRAIPSPPTQRAMIARARSSARSSPAWSCSRAARPRTIASKLAFTKSPVRATSETRAGSGHPSSVSRRCAGLR